MRKVFVGVMLGVPVLGMIYGLSVCQAQPRDWTGDAARIGGDVAAMVNYAPTDGATRAGQIRRDMHFTTVQPN